MTKDEYFFSLKDLKRIKSQKKKELECKMWIKLKRKKKHAIHTLGPLERSMAHTRPFSSNFKGLTTPPYDFLKIKRHRRRVVQPKNSTIKGFRTIIFYG